MQQQLDQQLDKVLEAGIERGAAPALPRPSSTAAASATRERQASGRPAVGPR